MNRELRIFVPRHMDAANTNAQNLNAKALLSRFTQKRARWIATHFNAPDSTIAAAPQLKLERLCRTRLWHSHMLLKYQKPVDAIFYPGMEWFDGQGLALRKMMGRHVPVIGTLEGLAGDEEREQQVEQWVGHKVYCHHVPREIIECCDRILHSCDHIIAITPMLATLGRRLYGDKVSMLPLGIDTEVFQRRHFQGEGPRIRVVTAATLTLRKRPFVVLEAARRFPSVDFVWFGTGPLLDKMRHETQEAGVENLSFPGNASPGTLAKEYTNSDLFVLPSFSEGAPKVLQEAAACGMPRIAFGFYEPAIANGVDGFVVWSDEEQIGRAHV
jgi:glycosyltransferase involved in cell wall biosynthesis